MNRTISKPDLDLVHYFLTVPKRTGIDLVARGESVWEMGLPHGPPTHQAFTQSIAALTNKIRTLTINHLSWKSFGAPGIFYPGGPSRAAVMCQNLSSLGLTIAVELAGKDEEDTLEQCRSIMKQGVLRTFIAALVCLKHVRIAIPNDNGDCYAGAVDLVDAISCTRSGLHSLSLQHFETSEEHIIVLLQNNANTFKNLSLKNMFLSPQESWVKIFGILRRSCQLESMKLEGELCDTVYMDVADSPNGTFDLGTEDG